MHIFAGLLILLGLLVSGTSDGKIGILGGIILAPIIILSLSSFAPFLGVMFIGCAIIYFVYIIFSKGI